MHYNDSDAAKWLRRLELRPDHDGWDEGGLTGALLALSAIDLPREDKQFLAGPFLEISYYRKPGWLNDLATEERFEFVMMKRPLVGPVEITTTLWVEFFSQEKRPDAVTELMRWAAVATQARHTGIDPAELCRMLGHEALANADVIGPEGRLLNVYTDLATRIRRRVVRILQEAEIADRERQRRMAKSEADRALYRDRRTVQPIIGRVGLPFGK